MNLKSIELELLESWSVDSGSVQIAPTTTVFNWLDSDLLGQGQKGGVEHRLRLMLDQTRPLLGLKQRRSS